MLEGEIGTRVRAVGNLDSRDRAHGAADPADLPGGPESRTVRPERHEF